MTPDPKQFSVTFIACLLISMYGLSRSFGQQWNHHVVAAHQRNLADVPKSNDAGDQIDDVLTRIILDNLPKQYEVTKDWGGQAERWDGIKLRREGWKIETSRRKKIVNHGTWKKYSASLRNPEQEFTVQIKNIHETDSGKLAFEFHLAAHLDIEGRQAEWVKGVQLYSVNAVGHARIRLLLSIEMDVKMGLSHFPPDLILIPQATEAKLMIDEFRIDRISKVGGEIAQQVSNGVRSKLDEKVAEKESKLVEKINRQLDKKKDDFRLSITDAMKSKWTQPLTGILAPTTKGQTESVK